MQNLSTTLLKVKKRGEMAAGENQRIIYNTVDQRREEEILRSSAVENLGIGLLQFHFLTMVKYIKLILIELNWIRVPFDNYFII